MNTNESPRSRTARSHHLQLLAVLFIELIIALPVYSAYALSIENLGLKDFTATSTTAAWTTDQASNTSAYWGENSTAERNKTIAEQALRHAISMDTTPAKSYTYIVTSCTDQNECKTSAPSRFLAGPNTGPPGLNITVPDFVNTNRVNLAVDTRPYSTVKLFLDGALSRIANPDETASGHVVFQNLALPKQENTLRIESTDQTGSKAEITIKVTVDTTPPELEIRNFPDVLQSPSFVLNGRVNKPSKIAIHVTPSNDRVPPPRTIGLKLKAVSQNQATLMWDASPDKDIGEYGIIRDNKLIGVSKTAEFTDTTPASGKTYNYRVQATDANCNKGDLSDSIDVKLPTGGRTDAIAATNASYTCSAPTYTIPSTDGDFAQPIQVTLGTSDIKIVATDRAGNTATYTNTTLFDNVPPVFVETNLDALSPSYTSDITIRGNVSEKSTVFVFINNEQTPSAFATTNDDGTFAVKAKLKRSTRVGETQAGTGGAGGTSGTSTTHRRFQEGDTGEGYLNTIRLQAVDLAKNKGDAGPTQVVLAQCGFGTGFTVDIGKPKPDLVNPRLVLKNFGTVGFNLDLKYLDTPETLDFLDTPSLHLRPVSLEDQPKYDMDVIPSLRCSQDNTKCYVQLTVRPPPGIDDKKTTLEKEKLISDHRKGECLVPGFGCYKIPLELEIRYQKKQPTGDLDQRRETFGTLGPRIQPQTQRVCIPVQIQIDKRIDPKLLPNSLLKTSVKLFDSAISTIDSVLKPLQTVFNVIFYACYLGFAVGFFLDFSQRKSCEGAVLVGALTQGSFNPEVAQNGLCDAYYPEGDSRLEQARSNCMSCQDSIASKKNTINSLHQLCDRIFCPSAPSLQKYITDMQRKGVKLRGPAPNSQPGATSDKQFVIGSDCASQQIKPNLYQGKEGEELGVDDIYQLYQLHKNDKTGGDKGVTKEAMSQKAISFTRATSASGTSSGSTFASSSGANAPLSKPGAAEGTISLQNPSKINCANLHPSVTECCGHEYQQKWGPVCSVMMPDFEITESRCLSAQQTGQGAVPGCTGFRQTLNAIGGFCSRSGDVSNDLVATSISYGKLTEAEGDPLKQIEDAKTNERSDLELQTGYLITESRTIFVTDDERKSSQQAQNDAIAGLFGTSGDLTRGKLPDYIKDRRVYLRIIPQEGGAFIVQRGYVVEKAVLSDLPSLDPTKNNPDPTKRSGTLTETLDFVPDLDVTSYFQAPREGGALLYPVIKNRWISALCSREAASESAGAAPLAEGAIPRAGQGKTAMVGCTPNSAQLAWDEVKRKIGIGSKDYIVNPAEDLSSSIKCGCIPGITSHLKKWKGILTAVRNCFNAVLVTGDGTPGACEAVLSRYVCDFIYTLIKCFVQRYTAGFQRPETEGGAGLLGIGSIGGMLAKGGTSVTQDLESRYGGSPTYKAAFSEEKMVNSICLFAFTGTFNLNPEALAEMEVGSIPVDSQPFLFPCERRFIQFDVSSDPPGLATWNYHVGADLFAGADLSYNLKLTCSAGFDCDPTEGFQNGQCDCSKSGEKTINVLSGNLKQFENIGEPGDVFQNVQQKWRFDRATLEWQYRDKDGKSKTGTHACKIETLGGDAPTFCAWDILSDSFRCSTDIFSEFFARFSGAAVPNYPDPLAQVFKLNDEVAFSVPITQRIPEGASCAGGRTCSSTKYLIYTLRNAQGSIIATNDQGTFDPSKDGADTTTDVTSFVEVEAEHVLNTQGEKIYTVKLPDPLNPEYFNLAGFRGGGSLTRWEVEPSNLQEFITLQRDPTANPPGFDLKIVVKNPSSGTAGWTAFTTTANPQSVDSGTIQNNRILTKGYIITIKPDKITRDFSIFIPSAQPSTIGQKRCDPNKLSDQTETWTATFEIRDATQQSFGTNTASSQTTIVNGRPQLATSTFKVICNTGLPMGRQRGECPEGRDVRTNCHCYDTREKVADAIAANSRGNCGLTATQPQVCLDGSCRNKGDLSICPTDRPVSEEGDGCVCGYDTSGREITCSTGQTCIMNPRTGHPNPTNECSDSGTSGGIDGGGSGSEGTGAGSGGGGGVPSGRASFNAAPPTGPPTMRVTTTEYHLAVLEDYGNIWTYTSNPRLGGKEACRLPPSQVGFYEAVKCEGHGKAFGKYYSHSSITFEQATSPPVERPTTATGTTPTVKRTIAVNNKPGTPCYIPYGSSVYIELPEHGGRKHPFTGWYTAEDTGSAFAGECKIDIYTGEGLAAARAANAGAPNAKVWVFPSGTPPGIVSV